MQNPNSILTCVDLRPNVDLNGRRPAAANIAVAAETDYTYFNFGVVWQQVRASRREEGERFMQQTGTGRYWIIESQKFY